MIQAMKNWWRGAPQPSEINTPQTQNRPKVTDSAQGTLNQLGQSFSKLPTNSNAKTNSLENSWCSIDLERARSEERFQEFLKTTEKRSASEGRGQVDNFAERILNVFQNQKPQKKITDTEDALERAKQHPMSVFYEKDVSEDNAKKWLNELSKAQRDKSVDQQPTAVTVDDLSWSTLAAGVTLNGETLQLV